MILLEFPEMCIYIIDKVESKKMTDSSLLTYAVASLCFGLKRNLLSAIHQKERKSVQRYPRSSEYRELS